MTKKRITKVSNEDIQHMEDLSRPDAPEAPELGPDFWDNARVIYPEGLKQQLTVRFDSDVVEWFKKGGRGYQTRMNAVLRTFVQAQRPK